jgi:hypothetical protein
LAFGAGPKPRVQSSVGVDHLPTSPNPGAAPSVSCCAIGCGGCGGSCCGTPARKSNKINAVAVLRLGPGAGVNTARRGRAPFLIIREWAAASCLVNKMASCSLNQTEHAPDRGGTGGQQSSVKGRLLRGSTVSSSMDRGPHSQLLVGWNVFDRRVAPVARGLGGDLGRRRLIVLGCWLIARARPLRRCLCGPSAAFLIMRPSALRVFQAFALADCVVIDRFLNPVSTLRRAGHRTRDYANR